MSNPTTITTNGWDTVFATNYTNINAQIAAQWKQLSAQSPNLSTMAATMVDGKLTFTLNLNLSAWSLTQGASGSLVRLQLPISSGSFEGLSSYPDLSGQIIIIELSLAWVPQPGQINFAISSNLKAIEADLGATAGVVTDNIVSAFKSGGVALASSATITIITAGICWRISDPVSTNSYYLYVTNVEGSDSLIEVYQYVTNNLSVPSPGSSIATPVTIIQAGSIDDPVDGPVFREMIANNIDQNLKEFDFVFASVDVVTQLSKDDEWAWLQPTAVEYAVVEPAEDPTNDNCVFAVLSMVNNNKNPKPVRQVDINAIDPYATHSLLISPTMFLTNMLASGVSAVFEGSTASNFDLDLDNLSITNNTELTWGNFILDNNNTISLTVDKNDFAMSMQNNRITVNFSNLSYPIKGFFDTIELGSMNIIFSGEYQLGLQEGGNGNKTLWFSVPVDQAPITDVSAVMGEAYYTTEMVIAAISMCLAVVGIGGKAASSVCENAAKNVLVDAGEATATATTAEIQAAFKMLLADEGAFVKTASTDALAAVKWGAASISQANLWSTVAKWAARLAGLTGLVAGGMQYYQATLEQASQEQWENTPSFGNFANLAISRYSFGTESPALLDVDLAESLRISFVTASGGVGGKKEASKPQYPTKKPTDTGPVKTLPVVDLKKPQ